MTRKTYIVDWASDMIFALNRIERNIPCMVIFRDGNTEDFGEVDIICRVEDVAYVERELAPYV